MNLPNSIPHYFKCPYCTFDNFESKLEWQKAKISLNHFINKKRSLKRKDKIKRINEL